VAFEEGLTTSSFTPRRLPRPMSELCIARAEEVARNFELPGMVSATFYAMLLNDAVELGIVNRFMTVDLKVTLEGL